MVESLIAPITQQWHTDWVILMLLRNLLQNILPMIDKILFIVQMICTATRLQYLYRETFFISISMIKFRTELSEIINE